ncbi:MAG: Acyl-CoA dehydrogenase, partial [uncultured Solirubrobacterales bacterium]
DRLRAHRRAAPDPRDGARVLRRRDRAARPRHGPRRRARPRPDRPARSARLPRRDRLGGLRRARARPPLLRADRRGGRPRLLVDAHGGLRPDLAGVRDRRALRHRSPEARLAAAPVRGRGARVLRPHRAGHRLRRRERLDASRAHRGRLVDHRPEAVDLVGHARRAGADLRPDRSRARPPRPGRLSRPRRRRRLRGHGHPRQARPARRRHRGARPRRRRGLRRRAARRGRRGVQGGDVGARLRPVQRRGRMRGDLPGVGGCLGGVCGGPPPVRPAARRLPAGAGADRRHDRRHRSRAGARMARGLGQGRRPAEHARDLGGQALRHRGLDPLGQRGDPGARGLRLRRRLPRGALPARRPGDHPVRGHLADPEADHRARGDRHRRDDL